MSRLIKSDVSQSSLTTRHKSVAASASAESLSSACVFLFLIVAVFRAILGINLWEVM